MVLKSHLNCQFKVILPCNLECGVTRFHIFRRFFYNKMIRFSQECGKILSVAMKTSPWNRMYLYLLTLTIWDN